MSWCDLDLKVQQVDTWQGHWLGGVGVDYGVTLI